MKQNKCIMQNTPQNTQGCLLPTLSLFSVQRRFNRFKIPVTELMPHKFVKRSGCIIKPVTVKPLGNFFAHTIESGQNPSVHKGKRFGGYVFIRLGYIGQGKTGGVPDFVDKISIAFNTLFRHFHISALGCKSGQGKSECIGSKAVNNAQGIDDISGRLTHLFAFLITHQGMHINIFKGHFLHEMDTHHHHPRDPEEENIKTGNKNRCGIKQF